MTLEKIAGLYSLLAGGAMVPVWITYFVTGAVMGASPAETGLSFHIAAEFATAAVMVAGGIGLLTQKPWAVNVYMLGMGMMIYALVNSPGLYSGSGAGLLHAVFAGSFLATVVFTVIGLKLGSEEITGKE